VTRRQVPNALTIARLLLIPVFVVLIAASDGGYSWPAAIVFGVAGITDQVDGFLARRWNVESAFGKIADPLADRLMIDTAVIMLIYESRLPWIALLIPLRDRARPRLRVSGKPGRESGDMASVRLAGPDHGHSQRHRMAALDLLDRPGPGVRIAG
jgi:CDP-diacylglycerol--glycerol-3-phosphate 3-phosphatidyltransferase